MPMWYFLTRPWKLRCPRLAIVLTEFAQLARFQTTDEHGDIGRGDCATKLLKTIVNSNGGIADTRPA